MDNNNIGLPQNQEVNQEYKILLESLDSMRAKIADEELNQAIELYLKYSYSWNNFLLFILYLKPFKNDYFKYLPTIYRNIITETHLKGSIDTHMYRLLTNVSEHINDTLYR